MYTAVSSRCWRVAGGWVGEEVREALRWEDKMEVNEVSILSTSLQVAAVSIHNRKL